MSGSAQDLVVQLIDAVSGEVALEQPANGEFLHEVEVGPGVWVARIWPPDEVVAMTEGVAIANPVRVQP